MANKQYLDSLRATAESALRNGGWSKSHVGPVSPQGVIELSDRVRELEATKPEPAPLNGTCGNCGDSEPGLCPVHRDADGYWHHWIDGRKGPTCGKAWLRELEYLRSRVRELETEREKKCGVDFLHHYLRQLWKHLGVAGDFPTERNLPFIFARLIERAREMEAEVKRLNSTGLMGVGTVAEEYAYAMDAAGYPTKKAECEGYALVSLDELQSVRAWNRLLIHMKIFSEPEPPWIGERISEASKCAS